MRARRKGFTLIELLVVVAIVALLVGLLSPSLAGARRAGQSARCLTNQRQLVTAWTLYADHHDGRAMPLAYTDAARRTAEGDNVFWWGTDGSTTGRAGAAGGLLTPYLDAGHHAESVYECPSQHPDAYTRQGGDAAGVTSTYGYNGYYLSPAHTPGWSGRIKDRPWRRLTDLHRPAELFVFADTLIRLGGSVRNTALLDPPMLYRGPAGWRRNSNPTTSFRHDGRPGPGARTIAAHADGSVASRAADEPGGVDRDGIGSVTAHNDPAYVPDWRRWAVRRTR